MSNLGRCEQPMNIFYSLFKEKIPMIFATVCRHKYYAIKDSIVESFYQRTTKGNGSTGAGFSKNQWNLKMALSYPSDRRFFETKRQGVRWSKVLVSLLDRPSVLVGPVRTKDVQLDFYCSQGLCSVEFFSPIDRMSYIST
jgi:hypothetical protein